jgi:hypothetical protein
MRKGKERKDEMFRGDLALKSWWVKTASVSFGVSLCVLTSCPLCMDLLLKNNTMLGNQLQSVDLLEELSLIIFMVEWREGCGAKVGWAIRPYHGLHGQWIEDRKKCEGVQSGRGRGRFIFLAPGPICIYIHSLGIYLSRNQYRVDSRGVERNPKAYLSVPYFMFSCPRERIAWPVPVLWCALCCAVQEKSSWAATLKSFPFDRYFCSHEVIDTTVAKTASGGSVDREKSVVARHMKRILFQAWRRCRAAPARA